MLQSTVSINKTPEILPEDFVLEQNSPNPFNAITVINYQLPVEGHVSLKVYNMFGKEIMELVNECKPAGKYSVIFDGTIISSNIYLYMLKADNVMITKKMILIKIIEIIYEKL